MPRALCALAMTHYRKCGGAGRCGERTERRQWRMKRSERVAAVKISSVRRKAAQKFWAPQQDTFGTAAKSDSRRGAKLPWADRVVRPYSGAR